MNGLERAIQGLKYIQKDQEKMTKRLQLTRDKTDFLLASLEQQKIKENKEKENR